MCWTWNPQTRDGAQWHLTRDDAERFCLQNPPHVIYSSRCDPFHQPPFPEQVGAPPPPPIAMAVEPGLRRSRRNTAAAAVPAAAVPAGGLLPTHLAAGLTLPDTHAPAAGGKLEQGAETGMAVLRALVNSAGGLPTPVRLACTHNDASVDFSSKSSHAIVSMMFLSGWSALGPIRRPEASKRKAGTSPPTAPLRFSSSPISGKQCLK